MFSGVPVLCSDIPEMKEQQQRTGGEILWFNARNIDSLFESFKLLMANYSMHKNNAETQVHLLKQRSWREVAQDYLRVLPATTNNDQRAPAFGSAGPAPHKRPSDHLDL